MNAFRVSTNCETPDEPPSLFLCVDRERERYQGAAGACAFDFEGSTDNAGAVIHYFQAHAGRTAFQIRERPAVVPDLEDDAVRTVGQADGHLLRLAVLDGVGHSLLSDLVHLIDRPGLKLRNRSFGLEPAGNLKE